MTTNRLTGPPEGEMIRMTALEWAQWAREKGFTQIAEVWQQAHLEGWDVRNHSGEPKWAAAMRKHSKKA